MWIIYLYSVELYVCGFSKLICDVYITSFPEKKIEYYVLFYTAFHIYSSQLKEFCNNFNFKNSIFPCLLWWHLRLRTAWLMPHRHLHGSGAAAFKFKQGQLQKNRFHKITQPLNFIPFVNRYALLLKVLWIFLRLAYICVSGAILTWEQLSIVKCILIFSLFMYNCLVLSQYSIRCQWMI